MAGGRAIGGGPGFERAVATDGYAWWYVDAISDDGQYGLTIIAFIGSVFSPYYARARRRGVGDPENFVSLNVALYGRSGHRWSMTERGRAALARDAEHLVIGPSALRWDGRGLTLEIDERTVPVPGRLKGQIRLHPSAVVDRSFQLDAEGEHTWRPIAPVSRVEVALERPSLSWSGHGYFDHNRGSVPLERTFRCWDWSRAGSGGAATIFYDVSERDGRTGHLALRIGGDGSVVDIEPPPRVVLPASPIWRIERETRSDSGTRASVTKTLEDTPFYARSLVRAQVAGEDLTAVHESLSLSRFVRPIVQAMLPFRMPRRAF